MAIYQKIYLVVHPMLSPKIIKSDAISFEISDLAPQVVRDRGPLPPQKGPLAIRCESFTEPSEWAYFPIGIDHKIAF